MTLTTTEWVAELERWNPARWQPRAVFRRFLDWTHASRKRKILVGAAVVVLLAVVIPCIIGAIAMATTTHKALSPGVSANQGVSWTGITDSYGVPVASYVFSTGGDSILHPVNTAISIILDLQFAGFIVLATFGIWMITYALSFHWLDVFANIFVYVANGITSQIGILVMVAIGATIGAFFVAYFTIRGFHAKAMWQVAVMLGVALFGVTIFANPVANVLSSHGVLAFGRDIGVSVAAGINGQTGVGSTSFINTIEQTLVEYLVRRPTQLWNFGHVVDSSPACAFAWSAGALSGNSTDLANNMKSCGDVAAYASATNPSPAEIGAGFMILIFGTILLFFGVLLAFKIFSNALNAVYDAFLSIFGWALGGFIYGPTQNFLVSNVVGTFIYSAKMCAFVIYTGIYCVVLGRIFAFAPLEPVRTMMIAGVFMMLGFIQLNRVDFSVDLVGQQISRRIATAIAGNNEPGGHGGGTPPLGGFLLAGATQIDHRHHPVRNTLQTMSDYQNIVNTKRLFDLAADKRAIFGAARDIRDNPGLGATPLGLALLLTRAGDLGSSAGDTLSAARKHLGPVASMAESMLQRRNYLADQAGQTKDMDSALASIGYAQLRSRKTDPQGIVEYSALAHEHIKHLQSRIERPHPLYHAGVVNGENAVRSVLMRQDGTPLDQDRFSPYGSRIVFRTNNTNALGQNVSGEEVFRAMAEAASGTTRWTDFMAAPVGPGVPGGRGYGIRGLPTDLSQVQATDLIRNIVAHTGYGLVDASARFNGDPRSPGGAYAPEWNNEVSRLNSMSQRLDRLGRDAGLHVFALGEHDWKPLSI